LLDHYRYQFPRERLLGITLPRVSQFSRGRDVVSSTVLVKARDGRAERRARTSWAAGSAARLSFCQMQPCRAVLSSTQRNQHIDPSRTAENIASF